MHMKVALAGNPNCGKTTLFNQLTGSNQYVGNWPGVTVEKKEGPYLKDAEVTITDLPGVYSLSPYSPEEVVTRDYLLNERPDAIIDLVDATNLERNLYLTLQMIDTGVPVVLALNMMDVARKNGMRIDVEALSLWLGCSVVETAAAKGEGIDALMKQVLSHARKGGSAGAGVPMDAPIEGALARVSSALPGVSPRLRRWYAIKLLEGDERVSAESDSLDASAKAAIASARADLERAYDDEADGVIAAGRYDAIEHALANIIIEAGARSDISHRIDDIVTNRWLGIPIFVILMTLVYFISVSTVGTMATNWMNDGVFGDGWDYWGTFVPGIPVVLGDFLAGIGCADWLQSLILDGIIGGVGAVLGFVPQMIVLFLLLSILEDCGYMSRIAFMMDRVFHKFGLSGKSFIPLLVSSGCGVPGIMSTRTIENECDRRMTIMTTTFVPCSAKLPMIALVFGALAGSAQAWWVAPLFYFLGIGAVIISGLMLKKFKRFAGEATPFVMELPRYHMPNPKGVILHTWERVRGFIVKAGTVIFVCSVILWFLLNFGIQDGRFAMLDTTQASAVESSFLAMIGSAIAWVFAPLGFGNWQSAVATLTGLVAKENVVTTFGVLANLGEAAEGASMWTAFASIMGGQSPAIVAFCAFNLLCAPCVAAIGAIRRAMDDWHWTLYAVAYQCVFAYAVALMINQFGMLIAGGDFTLMTLAAVIVAGVILFLLFRPDPDRGAALDDGASAARGFSPDGEDAGRNRRAERK